MGFDETDVSAQSGRVALVTGANTGIGKEIALALGRAGASVVVNYCELENQAAEIVKQLRVSGCNAASFRADVASEQQVLAMFEFIEREFGRLDILVNNAGIESSSPLVDMSLEQWQKVIAVNLTGQFLCVREAVRVFKSRPRLESSAVRGKIVCVSSVHESLAWAGNANYAVSKAGVGMLVKTAALELAGLGIRINAVAPGVIQTRLTEAALASQSIKSHILGLIPSGRIGTTADVAEAVLWLCSDRSDYVHGVTLYVDGAMHLQPEPSPTAAEIPILSGLSKAANAGLSRLRGKYVRRQ
jgi:glucose 1-dehydrogenase